MVKTLTALGEGTQPKLGRSTRVGQLTIACDPSFWGPNAADFHGHLHLHAQTPTHTRNQKKKKT